MSKEKYGYVSVDLWVFGYKNELVGFANDVEQVFYVPELAKKNWYVEQVFYVHIQFDEIPSFDTSYKPRLLGNN
jgi:hypothetical protein